MIWPTIAPVRRLWMAAEALVWWGVAPRESGSADARALSAVTSSRLGQAIDHALATGLVAWRHSMASTICSQVASRVQEQTVPGRVRLAGGLTASASATVLVAQRLTPRPEPLTWIVPALCLFAGVCLIAVARERSAR